MTHKSATLSRRSNLTGLGVATVGALLVMSALLLFPVSKANAFLPPFTFDSYYGTGHSTTFGGTPAVEATSTCTVDCAVDVTFGGAIFNAPTGFTIGDISTLSTQYYRNGDDCALGAPRFSLWLDALGNKEVWVYFGPTNFGGPGCVSGSWRDTGNFAGSVAAGQSAKSVFPNTTSCGNGNVAYTWSDAVACLGASTQIFAISVDVDGGTTTTNQDFLFNCDGTSKAITINDFHYQCPTVKPIPEFPYGIFALLAVAVPALILVKSRALKSRA